MASIAQAITTVTGRRAEMGVGTVLDVATTTLTLLIRGAEQDTAYLASYKPNVGDLVAFIRQDATFLVLGALGGIGGNQVLNSSFEDDGPTGTIPSNWNLAALSGAADAEAVQTGYAPAGSIELAVSSGDTAADTYVYSAPIGVTPGDEWAVSALTTAVYPAGTDPSADSSLVALWFADAVSLYPTTAVADTLIAQVNNIDSAPIHTSVSGTVTVPPAAAFLRIATRSISGPGITVQWDTVIARRIA